MLLEHREEGKHPTVPVFGAGCRKKAANKKLLRWSYSLSFFVYKAVIRSVLFIAQQVVCMSICSFVYCNPRITIPAFMS